jgi:hypothetical protein
MARQRDRIISSKTKDRYKNIIQGVVGGLSENIILYLQPQKQECPNCFYDKIHDKSTGIAKVLPSDPNYFIVGRCPICLGKGTLTSIRKRCIQGMIIWNPGGDGMNSTTYTSSGYEGATKVELKINPCYLDLVKSADYFSVAGLKCRMSNPPIIRGLGSSALLIVELFTESKMEDGIEHV